MDCMSDMVIGKIETVRGSSSWTKASEDQQAVANEA